MTDAAYRSPSDPLDVDRDVRIFVGGLSWPVRLSIRTSAGTAEIAHVAPRAGKPRRCPCCGHVREVV
jgi:hypothetical protein